MARENLRDSLPGAGKRRDAEPPKQFYRATSCEYRNGACMGRGKPDIAIQDASGQPQGYVCQKCYAFHVANRGLDQMACVKVEGIRPREDAPQSTLDQQRTYQHVTEALQMIDDFDRYAESMAHAKEDDDADL